MDKELINAYAHGNLQRSLLLILFSENIKKSCAERFPEPATDETRHAHYQRALDLLHGDLVRHLRSAEFPLDDDSEAIRAESILLSKRFVEDVREILMPGLIQ
jgi:hypothetical protein